MAGVQLNAVFLFSPSQAVSESGIFEQEYHFLRYRVLNDTAYIFALIYGGRSYALLLIRVDPMFDL